MEETGVLGVVILYVPSLVLSLAAGSLFKIFAPKFFPNYGFARSVWGVIVVVVVVFILSAAWLLF